MTSLSNSILVLNLAAASFMTGLVWMVQIVHYPLFAGVGAAWFSQYAADHQRKITYIVAPAMVIEAGAAVLLLWFEPAPVPPWTVWAGILLLALIWLSTGLVQIPEHSRLTGGFDEASHQRLVASNWIRTIAWTLRALLAAGMTSVALGRGQ